MKESKAILNTIIEEAQQEAEKIRANARELAMKEQQAFEIETKKAIKQVKEVAQKNIEEQERRFNAIIDLDRRKAELLVRRDCVEHVYRLLKERILAMDPTSYEKLLFGWVNESAMQDDVLYSSIRDAKFFDQGKLEDKLNGKVRYGGTTDQIQEGFLLCQSDTQMDCSLEAAIERLRDAEGQVAQILFHNQEEQK